MLPVTVKLFAIYQETVGSGEVHLNLPLGSRVGTILDRLVADYPELESWREVTRFGINLEFVQSDTPLQPGDEVVLIPPVSGG